MLDMIKNIFAEKVGMRVMLRGVYSPQAAVTLQNIVRSYNLMGWVQVVKNSHAMIELEGPKPKMEALLADL